MANKLKSTVLGDTNLMGTKATKGRSVALNLTKCSYLRVESLCLTVNDPVGIIPYSMTDDAIKALQLAITDGRVIMSDRPIDPVDRDDKMLRVYNDFDALETTTEIQDYCLRVASGQVFVHRGVGPIEILEAMIKYEEENQNRAEILTIIRGTIDRSPGFSGVIKEGDDESIQIRIHEGLIQVMERPAEGGEKMEPSGPDMSEFV